MDRELISAVAGISDFNEMARFLEEILTPSEQENLSLRWQLMKMLNNGVSQRKIADELGISLCKITRGAKIINDSTSVTYKLLKNGEK